MNNLKQQIFVSVAAAITQKWPIQSNNDHKEIANTALKLTNTLYEKYMNSTQELINEQQVHMNDQARVPDNS